MYPYPPQETMQANKGIVGATSAKMREGRVASSFDQIKYRIEEANRRLTNAAYRASEHADTMFGAVPSDLNAYGKPTPVDVPASIYDSLNHLENTLSSLEQILARFEG